MVSKAGNKGVRPPQLRSETKVVQDALELVDEQEEAALRIFQQTSKLAEEMRSQKAEIAEILKNAGHAGIIPKRVQEDQVPIEEREIEGDIEVSSLDSDNSAGIPLSEYLRKFPPRDDDNSSSSDDSEVLDAIQNIFALLPDEVNDEEEEKV